MSSRGHPASGGKASPDMAPKASPRVPQISLLQEGFRGKKSISKTRRKDIARTEATLFALEGVVHTQPTLPAGKVSMPWRGLSGKSLRQASGCFSDLGIKTNKRLPFLLLFGGKTVRKLPSIYCKDTRQSEGPTRLARSA